MIKRITNLALAALNKNESRAIFAAGWYDYAGRFCAEIDRDNSIAPGTTAGLVSVS